MERRRRKASSKAASSVVETKAEPGRKPAKLVLKTPAALSPPGLAKHAKFYTFSPLTPPAEKKPRVSSILEDCITSETPEEVLEQLLSITTGDVGGLRQDGERCLGVLRELWRKWKGRGDVCTVIVRVFVELVTSGGGEPGEEERDFVLQLADHGKLLHSAHNIAFCKNIFLQSWTTSKCWDWQQLENCRRWTLLLCQMLSN